MANINDLKTRASGIRQETGEGKNTAERVGGLLYDMIVGIEENAGSITNLTTTVNNITKGGGGDSLVQPLLGINNAKLGNPSANIAIVFNGSSWQYMTLADLYKNGKDGYNGQQGKDGKDGDISSVKITELLDTGTKIGVIDIDGTEYILYAPAGGNGTVSITDRLDTGKLIAKINGVELYAPEGDSNTGGSVSVSSAGNTGALVGTINSTEFRIPANVVTGDDVTASLSSSEGIAIATIKGKTIYAPSTSTTITGSKVTARTRAESGTWLATLNIDGTDYNIYAPENEGGGNNPGGVTEEEMQEAIDNAKKDIQEVIGALDKDLDAATKLANSEKTRLDDLINSIDGTVSTKVETMIKDANWIQNNFPESVISKWASDNLEEYLQGIGVWYDNGKATNTTWSQFVQRVNTIETAVNALSSDGNITEALQSSINQSVQDGIASLNLETMYAKKDAESVLEWMYSALKNQSSSDMTFNRLVSAAKSGSNSGISEIRTYVEKLAKGEYLAVSNVESKVNDAITGLYNKATANDAQTTIFSTVKANSSDIATIITEATGDSSSATIAAKFKNWKAGLVTYAGLDEAIAGLAATNGTTVAGLALKSEVNAARTSLMSAINDLENAGFISSSDLDNQMASIFAQDGKASAYVTAAVKNGVSNATIKADRINFDGVVWADLINLNELLAKWEPGDEWVLGDIETYTGTGAQVRGNGFGTWGGGGVGLLMPNYFKIEGGAAYGNPHFIVDCTRVNAQNLVNLKNMCLSIDMDTNYDMGYGMIQLYYNNTETSIYSTGIASNGNFDLSANNLTLSASSISTKANDLLTDSDFLLQSGGTMTISANNGDGNLSIEARSTHLYSSLSIDGSTIIGWDLDVPINIGCEDRRGYIDAEGDLRIAAGDGDDANMYLFGESVNVNTGSHFYSNRNLEVSSDERLKNISGEVNADVSAIAKARVVDYSLKDSKNDSLHLGTIAQDWKEIFPNAVGESKDGYLSLDYSAVALASSVACAKEIVQLKAKIEALSKALSN